MRPRLNYTRVATSTLGKTHVLSYDKVATAKENLNTLFNTKETR